jgi:hypothetical protein
MSHIVGGGLDGDLLDPLLDQVIGEFGDGVGCGRYVPHPADPPIRPIVFQDPDADLSRRLRHIDRAHPLDDQLVIGSGITSCFNSPVLLQYSGVQ